MLPLAGIRSSSSARSRRPVLRHAARRHGAERDQGESPEATACASGRDQERDSRTSRRSTATSARWSRPEGAVQRAARVGSRCRRTSDRELPPRAAKLGSATTPWRGQPSLVYCSISAYGQTAARQKRLRSDRASGERRHERDRRQGGAPVKCGVPSPTSRRTLCGVRDLVALHRVRGRSRDYIDVSMLAQRSAWRAADERVFRHGRDPGSRLAHPATPYSVQGE